MASNLMEMQRLMRERQLPTNQSFIANPAPPTLQRRRPRETTNSAQFSHRRELEFAELRRSTRGARTAYLAGRMLTGDESRMGDNLSTTVLGAARELQACALLLFEGFQVFRNVSPQGSIDVVAFRGGKVYRVQVKSDLHPMHLDWDLQLVIGQPVLWYVPDAKDHALPRLITASDLP
jgi:hypothetical protein